MQTVAVHADGGSTCRRRQYWQCDGSCTCRRRQYVQTEAVRADEAYTSVPLLLKPTHPLLCSHILTLCPLILHLLALLGFYFIRLQIVY